MRLEHMKGTYDVAEMIGCDYMWNTIDNELYSSYDIVKFKKKNIKYAWNLSVLDVIRSPPTWKRTTNPFPAKEIENSTKNISRRYLDKLRQLTREEYQINDQK